MHIYAHILNSNVKSKRILRKIPDWRQIYSKKEKSDFFNFTPHSLRPAALIASMKIDPARRRAPCQNMDCTKLRRGTFIGRSDSRLWSRNAAIEREWHGGTPAKHRHLWITSVSGRKMVGGRINIGRTDRFVRHGRAA